MNMDKKEYDEMMRQGRLGLLECEYCIHYESHFAPREDDFDAYCNMKNRKIKNINYEDGCLCFDMGSQDNW